MKNKTKNKLKTKLNNILEIIKYGPDIIFIHKSTILKNQTFKGI